MAAGDCRLTQTSSEGGSKLSELKAVLAQGLGRGRVVFCMTQCYSGGFHFLGVPRAVADYIEIARELEAIALADEYFIERKLYPNVDFYSGILYRAMGIPTNMFTVMFAIGRLPGWIAQWKEMKANKEPIGRPRQVYVGATPREYVSMDQR